MTSPRIPSAVSAYLQRHDLDDASVAPLTPDASDRRYYRITRTDGSTFVLAVLVGAFDSATLPFLNVAGLFATMPVAVPRIIGEAADLGVLALDDLGDVTMQKYLETAAPDMQRAVYREAVGLIAVMQRRGRELADPKYLPYGLAFDEGKLTWELEFFVKHFIESYRQAPLTPTDRTALDEEFAAIVGELASEPRVLCHRDFHSRNLMVDHGRLHVIDFQDARLGPNTYDLVSLLRDSYVDIPESLVTDLIDEFFSMTNDATGSVDRRARFDLMAVQRNLKALGTFGYQSAVRGNTAYLDAIPRTLQYVRRNLYGYDRFARLRSLLARYVDELHP